MIARFALALGVVLGLQMLRAFFPLLLYVLKDRAGQPSSLLGLEAVLLFATGFLAPRLGRRAHGFAIALFALGGLRAALQFWNGDPAVSLAIAAAAVPAFLALLAAPAPDRAGGILLGAALDAGIHAAAGTRDLHWSGGGADLAAGFLAGGAIAFAWALLRGRGGNDAPAAPPGFAAAFATGPFLLLQLEILGNVARASARTGAVTATSGACVAGGLAAAFLLAPHLARTGPGIAPRLAAAAILVALARMSWTGAAGVAALAIAQLAAGFLLVHATAPNTAPRGAGAASGLGAVTLVVLLFLHYAGYDLPLPFSGPAVWQAAAALFALAALATGGVSLAPPLSPARPLAWVALAAVALPLARGTPRAAAPPADPDDPVVVTFNLHAGFDERGGWAFDRMMDELRAARPDVVALQEVSRGWLINGGADLFELSRERLGLHGVPGPGVRNDWGSAVFSRRAILASETAPLPPAMNLSRAATRAELAPGRGPRVVVATHLHHREGDDAVREQQAAALTARFPASPEAVLLGDFNALPESGTFAVLRAAGWADAAGDPVEARLAPTYPSREPVRRIDTILVGDPARVAGLEVAPAWGSDHRAVILRWSPVTAGATLERP